MIDNAKFYSISCDVCGEVNEDHDGGAWWSDDVIAMEKARDNEWYIQEDNNIAICEDCAEKLTLNFYIERDIKFVKSDIEKFKNEI